MMTMERKQIYLATGSDARLKKLAKRKGVSEASLIREAVDQYLAKAESETAEDEGRDPLLRLVGLYQGAAPADGAANHDQYLYGREDGR